MRAVIRIPKLSTMSATATVSILPSAAAEPASLHLIAEDAKKEEAVVTEEPYRYAHLLATYSQVKYPALQPFEHVDAGFRALKHPDPRSFLANSSAIEMSPEFGLDVRGCNLAELTAEHTDQLALEVRKIYSIRHWHDDATQVARRGVVVFRDQQDFIDRGAGFYTQWAVTSVLYTSTPLQAILTAITKSTWLLSRFSAELNESYSHIYRVGTPSRTSRQTASPAPSGILVITFLDSIKIDA